MSVSDVTVVVPALNEEQHLPRLLSSLPSYIASNRVIVVDNGSEDATADLASSAGVQVVVEDRRGKGFAVRAGVAVARTDRVFLCDADVVGIREEIIAELRTLGGQDSPVCRLSIERPVGAAPVTELVAKPMLRALGIPCPMEPLGGLALVDREFLLGLHLPGGWGFDIALTLSAVSSGHGLPELRCGGVSHREKPIAEYREMASEVAAAILRGEGLVDWEHGDCVRCRRPGHNFERTWLCRMNADSNERA